MIYSQELIAELGEDDDILKYIGRSKCWLKQLSLKFYWFERAVAEKEKKKSIPENASIQISL